MALRLRALVLVVFEAALVVLSRLSPRLVAFIDSTLEEARATSLRARSQSHRGIEVPAGEVSFTLVLPAGHRLAHFQYVEQARRVGAYEPVATALLGRLLRYLEHPRFMDIGAWMGYFTCYAAALCGSRCSVYAVESNPAFARLIDRAVAINGFRQTSVYRVALSDRHEKARIDDAAVTPAVEGEAGVIADTVTLDELCTREGIRPNVLKVDVHGAEGVVLRGGRRLLAESVEFALIELHPPVMLADHSRGMTPSEVLDVAMEAGLHLFYVAGHRYDHVAAMVPGLMTSRFSYRPLTRETRSLLLCDRQLDVLVLASRAADLEPVLGPPVEDAWERPEGHRVRHS